MGNFPATRGKIRIDIEGRQVLGTFNGWNIPIAQKSSFEPLGAYKCVDGGLKKVVHNPLACFDCVIQLAKLPNADPRARFTLSKVAVNINAKWFR